MDERLFGSAAQMVAAENYNDWTFDLFQHYVAGSVLEVGCGVGAFTKRIIERCRFERLLSIDISAHAVAYCRARLGHPALEFRCVDVEEVLGEFDTIICINVLEHVQDDRFILAHMLSLLRPTGTLFLLVPAHSFLFTSFDKASGHLRRYNKQHMQRLLLEAANGACIQFTQFYFNPIGALGYLLVYKILRKAPRTSAAAEIAFFDKWGVPMMRPLQGQNMPFGISLVSVITKGDNSTPQGINASTDGHGV